MLTLSPDSHLDHDLTPAHVAFLLALFESREDFFLETVTLHPDLPDLASSLYGPLAGDLPVVDLDHVRYAIRPHRRWASRLVPLPPRPTRLLTVIAGPTDEHSCVLYTAYGGPCAPREPGDLTLGSWDEIEEARAFWAQHALAAPIGGTL